MFSQGRPLPLATTWRIFFLALNNMEGSWENVFLKSSLKKKNLELMDCCKIEMPSVATARSRKQNLVLSKIHLPPISSQKLLNLSPFSTTCCKSYPFKYNFQGILLVDIHFLSQDTYEGEIRHTFSSKTEGKIANCSEIFPGNSWSFLLANLSRVARGVLGNRASLLPPISSYLQFLAHRAVGWKVIK